MKENIWIAFLLKDKYAGQNAKQALKNSIINKFNRKQNDIIVIQEQENSALSYYFFVKQYQYDDLSRIYQENNEFFDNFENHVKINEKELKAMLKDLYREENKGIKFGDLVTINKGKYNKLYGIVLRENRTGGVQVGLKFCFGTKIESYKQEDLTVNGNIFNYIKVLK